MSAATDSNIRMIYIPLLDEGVAVIRPTLARPLHGGAFLVLPTQNYDPDQETWAFPPGSSVLCEWESYGGENVLVARHRTAEAA